MKTSFIPRLLLLAACAGLGFSNPAHAATGDGQPVCVEQVSDFTYVVRVSNPSQKPTQLQLLRLDNGGVLYQGNSSAASFGRKFNIKNLEDGQYAIVVTTGSTTHRYTLNLQTTMQRTTSLNEVPQPQ
ncbi:hypothetical protein GCM10027048_06320 [Hymenobacter coalescens]